MLVDSHCHLDFDEIYSDLQGALNRAKSAGISKMVSISTRFSDLSRILKISTTSDDIYISAGLHPCHAHEESVFSAEQILSLLSHPKIIGLGETGLDYYRHSEHKDLQKTSFINHIIASQHSGLPVIVHTRDAESDTLEILSHQLKLAPFKGLIHCFTGSKEFAYNCLDLGMYISFSGVVTFKNATEIAELAKSIPIDRILVETDAPFLAPAPQRGKPNEPSYLRHTAEFIAFSRGMELQKFAEITTHNFFKLFSKACK